ncbi:MAG: hypothetical protein GY792_17515 [Gammaproteobacteria bacterium]|nr:hypothetical protein [Gammaproteobacteria bacterium]
MDYELIVSALQKASAFDLFRLQSAIGHLLDDPLRLNAIKRQLRPGMEITYFESQENRLISAQVLEIRRTRVAIRELQTGKRWTVPLYMINIEGADTDIAPNKNDIDRLSLKIGDQVGFTGKDGSEMFGTVIKLNPKRAKIQTSQGIWAVPYSMLFTIIDGERSRDQFVPAEIDLFTDSCINPAPDDDQ